MKIELTEKQMQLIWWALNAGLSQHQKFLRHDDWDFDMNKKQRHENLSSDRQFSRAIKVFKNAWAKAGGK